jgi:hypothetical protein
VNPDLQGTVKPPPLSKPSAKAALAAGMKPAALIVHELTVAKSSSHAAPALKPSTQVAARKKDAKRAHRKVAVKARPSAAHLRDKSAAKASRVSMQSASVQNAPVQATPTTTNAASPATGAGVTKPGTKPSPAIAKGEEHP